MSVRGAVAQQQGVNEELLAEVDHYEDSGLSPFQKAALRLADAYLNYPAGMTDEVRDEVLSHLTSAQIAELVLKLMGYSSDKIMVALGLDLEDLTIIPL